MKLTYWYSRCPNDSNCYSIREKTKREALAKVQWAANGGERWAHPIKVTIEYDSAFDLMVQCMTEDSGYWESEV
jgi:hypothetical protein|tara:strand:- start:93 stop:314 length:222 start_codon:yes stop_codon:yes gene_type:complete